MLVPIATVNKDLWDTNSRGETKTECYLCATLWQDKDRNEEVIDHQSNIRISDCAFSVIKHDSGEVFCKHGCTLSYGLGMPLIELTPLLKLCPVIECSSGAILINIFAMAS